MSFFQIIASYKCSNAMGTLVNAIQTVLNIIRWAIPIVLIILGSIDMFKGMTSGDDKEAEKAKKTFIRRLVYAVVAFLIPTLVTFSFDIVANITKDEQLNREELRQGNFFECWYQSNSQSNSAVDTNDYNDGIARCYDLREDHLGEIVNITPGECESLDDTGYGTYEDIFGSFQH